MNVRLADPARSRIVLIGTPFHTHADERLPDVPVVANNVADLAAVFTDPELAGFDAPNCVTAAPGATMPEIGELLTDAAENAKDLLLIYYAGHGLLDRRGQLHLALSGTHPDRLGFTALPYETLRAVCLDSAAKSRVVILDSCYSGRAIGSTLSGGAEQEILGQLEVRGTYTLTSAPANRTALILPGERHTAFTGRLVQLLRDGDPELGEVLAIGEIYKRLHARLTADGLPRPQQRGTETADMLGLVRNRRPARAAKAVLSDESSRTPAAGKPASSARPVNAADMERARRAATEAERAAASARADGYTAIPVLTDVARAWAAVDPFKAVRVAYELERLAATLNPDANGILEMTADAANTWAAVGSPDNARYLAKEVQQRATAVEDADRIPGALAAAACAWAILDPATGERIAETIADTYTREKALAFIVRVGAAQNPSAAEQIAKTITTHHLRVKALSEAARAWAAVNPRMARSLAGEAAIASSALTTENHQKVTAWAEVARAWGKVDPARARVAAEEAEEIYWRKTFNKYSSWLCADVARGWAAVDPGRATHIAATIEDDITGIILAQALMEAAIGWAAVDPDMAGRVAESISKDEYRARAFAAIAQAWAEEAYR